MIDIQNDLMKLGISLAFGMVIGLEREISDKAAGLRTNILICLGATLFTILSGYARISDTMQDYHIVAQIVAGVGFLGAGAIMRQGEQVTGLTTAATIWTVAAVGAAVGMGYYVVAAATTGIVLIVQVAFVKLDYYINELRQYRTFRFVCGSDERAVGEIEKIFRESHLKIVRRKLMKKEDGYHSEWYTVGSFENNEDAVSKFIGSNLVVEMTY